IVCIPTATEPPSNGIRIPRLTSLPHVRIPIHFDRSQLEPVAALMPAGYQVRQRLVDRQSSRLRQSSLLAAASSDAPFAGDRGTRWRRRRQSHSSTECAATFEYRARALQVTSLLLSPIPHSDIQEECFA